MSDPWPAEAESNAEWVRALDRLIDWAVAQADAAVEEICGYLNQRAAQPRDPGLARGSLPGRGRDHSCSSLRRRRRRLPG